MSTTREAEEETGGNLARLEGLLDCMGTERPSWAQTFFAVSARGGFVSVGAGLMGMMHWSLLPEVCRGSPRIAAGLFLTSVTLTALGSLLAGLGHYFENFEHRLAEEAKRGIPVEEIGPDVRIQVRERVESRDNPLIAYVQLDEDGRQRRQGRVEIQGPTYQRHSDSFVRVAFDKNGTPITGYSSRDGAILPVGSLRTYNDFSDAKKFRAAVSEVPADVPLAVVHNSQDLVSFTKGLPPGSIVTITETAPM